MMVAGLYVYPLKSAGGIRLDVADITRTGIRYDRQWLVIDERGMFVAQRGERDAGVGIKRMCQIITSFGGDELILDAPGMSSLTLPLAGVAGPQINVQIWRNVVTAIDQGDQASRWLSEFLCRERPGQYRLVRLPDDGIRKTKDGVGEIAFADGYPFLVVSQSSLEDLNRRLGDPLPMNRFRPNIVFGDADPYIEDHLAYFRIGNISFAGMMLCVRCPITTINQVHATAGKEPLKTLATYRKTEGGVVFGRNYCHRREGRLAVGNTVEVIGFD